MKKDQQQELIRLQNREIDQLRYDYKKALAEITELTIKLRSAEKQLRDWKEGKRKMDRSLLQQECTKLTIRNNLLLEKIKIVAGSRRLIEALLGRNEGEKEILKHLQEIFTTEE